MGHGSSFPQPCEDSRVVKTKFGYVMRIREVFRKVSAKNFEVI
ncbi:unnamed protein product [Haemonchus placei]|uniref:Transposase n=1 Tax=Haemonchus placei TaxID=6290 RepID=A0A0N4X2R2_HAEPC|nr:unnamed protein product [Haemonchus placei]